MKHGKMFRAFGVLVLTTVIFCLMLSHAGNTFAQSPRIKHVISTLQKDKGQSLGRDLWFTMAQNYENQGGKYYRLFVTSPNNTTVNIQVTGGTTSKWPITAGQVISFDVPLGWEVTTSCVVESKGIRVWSNNADLTAYLLSRNPATSDGMMIIPTIGWGKEYVVAAYASLFEGYGTFVYDYPSEFCIIANQNNTVCTITPSIDLRNDGPGPSVRKKDVPFTEVLQQGQCVQYQAVPATSDNFDVTGSLITSNNPIGVVGASQCPNIPVWFPYCDHICDMIPPIRTWAQTYQTVPFANRRGGDTYLVIGSVANQKIYRNGKPTNVYCTLDKKYDSYFRADIDQASLWESDAPFFLAQYINSTTWTDVDGKDNQGIGDPAMVVVNSVEQYVPKVIFQTPNIQGAGGFTNFCNVMVDKSAENKTLFDGKPITSFKGATRMPIPLSNYDAFRISSIQPGTHTVVSDSGVGVYVYGYGNYDSYAWSGSLGIKTFNDPDTIPPVATPTGECFTAYVTLTDNHLAPPASKISEMKIDSFYNMLYTPDPNYQIGVAATETFYNMNVIDSSKEAFLKIETHDYAGNRTIVTSTYEPQTFDITPKIQNYGSGNVGVETCKNFSIINTGKTVINWQYIKLLVGNRGFSIKNLDMSPLAIGASRDIMVCFTPPTPALASDTLELFDGCLLRRAVVVGTGGLPDYIVSGDDFGCQLVGSLNRKSGSTIVNTSKSVINIDSIRVDDKVHFGFDPNNPATNNISPSMAIPPNGQRPIEFTFTPDKIGNFTTTAHYHSQEIGWKTATLIGCGIAPGAHISRDTLQISQCGAVVPFAFTVNSTGSAETQIVSLVVDGDTSMFKPPTQFEKAGASVNLPVKLGLNEQFTAYMNFYPPAKASGTFTAKVFAISDKGDTTNFATATVIAYWRELREATKSVVMPVVPFGSAVEGSSFQYCNDLNDTVNIMSIGPVPGPYSAAFSTTNFKVGGVVRNPPFALAKGECVDIGVVFNPAVSPDSMQAADFTLVTNACTPNFRATAAAGVKIGPPTILGADIKPTILSCGTRDTFVTVYNHTALQSKITNITLSGDVANFTQGNPKSMVIAAGDSINIPVTFSPNATAGPLPTNYSATVVVNVTDATNKAWTLPAVITGSANGMSAVVSSDFAVQSAQASDKTILTLPIDIKFTKNGLSDPVDAFGITKVRLVYNYNTSILELATGSISTSVIPANGWTVDPASTVDNTTGTLTLILNGSSPLTDATGSLGEVHFYPTLAAYGSKSTNVTLASSDLLTAGGAAVGNCLAVSQKGTQFTLIYSCGDSTLAAYLLNGNAPSMIKPINPNPVSASNGGIVNFQYATKHEGSVSIVIYDELGKQVATVVGGLYHPAGTYEVHFDASHLPSGSYVYRFQLDHQHAISGRMVVNK